MIKFSSLFGVKKAENPPATPAHLPTVESARIIDQTENPILTECRIKTEKFLTEDLPAEEIRKILFFLITKSTFRRDSGFKISVAGVREIIKRLKDLGYTGESIFNARQESRRQNIHMEYTAEDSLNAFRSHCERLMSKLPADVDEAADFNLLNSDIILEI
jgi:hypothetical protein